MTRGAETQTQTAKRFVGRVTLISVLFNSWRLSRSDELNLPPMKEEKHLAAMKLLMTLCHATYMAGDPKISRYVLEMAHLSLKHGMAPESSFAFPALGSVFITYWHYQFWLSIGRAGTKKSQ